MDKHFAGLAALNSISFDVAAGEVLCLLGDNGAGKSTLIKVLSGVHRPTRGEVLLDGKPVELKSPREAQDLGIATVHQDVGVIALMSVARNFFLGAEITKGWGPFKRIDERKANNIVLEQMASMGIRRVRDGNQLVGVMSGCSKTGSEIGRFYLNQHNYPRQSMKSCSLMCLQPLINAPPSVAFMNSLPFSASILFSIHLLKLINDNEVTTVPPSQPGIF